jgi:hypothetical protein
MGAAFQGIEAAHHKLIMRAGLLVRAGNSVQPAYVASRNLDHAAQITGSS